MEWRKREREIGTVRGVSISQRVPVSQKDTKFYKTLDFEIHTTGTATL